MNKLALVEKIDGYYLKRNDLNEFCECFGGKAECIYDFILRSDVKRFVTCGSRDSLQCEIVSKMCDVLGYECHIFVPSGKDTVTTHNILGHKNTTLHRVENGYMVVVNRRAIDFATDNAMSFIPFGMRDMGAVGVIANQVSNIPSDVNRIIVPVGGGITMSGIMHGLVKYNRRDVEVVGVVTGKQPGKELRGFQPLFNPIKHKLVPFMDISPTKRYAMRVDCSIGDVKLDPIYEGKCYKFLSKGDLLWIVGYHGV